MEYVDRNTIIGFGTRVRKNYEFIAKAREQEEDVHLITQLLVSLLGLLVFPYEYLRRIDQLPHAADTLQDLRNDGWPEWTFILGHSVNLEDHLRYLRNALSHRRIEFTSDSRELENVDVHLWDQRKPYSDRYWEVSINAAMLRDFVFRFTSLIDTRL
jgi:hypothetical protein